MSWITSGSTFSIQILNVAKAGKHSHIFPPSVLVMDNVACNSIGASNKNTSLYYFCLRDTKYLVRHSIEKGTLIILEDKF